MIEDFVRQLLTALEDRKQDYVDALIASATAHEHNRGAVRGLEDAITAVKAVQTLYNIGPAPEPNLTILYSPRLPEGFRRFACKVAIDTSSLQWLGDPPMRSPFAHA